MRTATHPVTARMVATRSRASATRVDGQAVAIGVNVCARRPLVAGRRVRMGVRAGRTARASPAGSGGRGPGGAPGKADGPRPQGRESIGGGMWWSQVGRQPRAPSTSITSSSPDGPRAWRATRCSWRRCWPSPPPCKQPVERAVERDTALGPTPPAHGPPRRVGVTARRKEKVTIRAGRGHPCHTGGWGCGMAEERLSRQELIRRRRRSGFVGRRGEMNAFRENLDRNPEGDDYQFLFHVRGNAGVGKTSLVR